MQAIAVQTELGRFQISESNPVRILRTISLLSAI
jgi:hypothetical protein